MAKISQICMSVEKNDTRPFLDGIVLYYKPKWTYSTLYTKVIYDLKLILITYQNPDHNDQQSSILMIQMKHLLFYFFSMETAIIYETQ